ncbi:hypothetical protein INT47_011165 [Mucor saturninus]|uniref:Uncharacterized protein n=1 Tax=Mucor saturninus TaxID=64648 RepID=A0A8H7RNM3_9FUNG|nr:hypothetical protein INT47_011165 [Mucor saturninus]
MPASKEAAPLKVILVTLLKSPKRFILSLAFIMSSYESATEISEENPSEEKPLNEKRRLVPRTFILCEFLVKHATANQ